MCINNYKKKEKKKHVFVDDKRSEISFLFIVVREKIFYGYLHIFTSLSIEMACTIRRSDKINE